MVVRRLLSAAVRLAVDTVGPELLVAVRNRWARALGRGAAWDEGRDTALACAAMLAHDMGRPDIRQAINALIPNGSPYIPMDDPRCTIRQRFELRTGG